MNHPQTLAERLYVQYPSTKLKSVKENCCCIVTFMWCMGIDPDDAEALIIVGSLIDKGIIDPDCTVNWDKVSRHLTDRSCNIEKVDIKSISKIKERTPVYYERTYQDSSGAIKKKGHWVGVQNGKIRFNALENSLCVKEGKPVKARILHFSGDSK